MKNKIIIILIILFLTGIMCFIFYNQKNKNIIEQNQNKSGHKYKVAILLPVTHSALEEIKQGFMDTLQKDLNVDFKTYNANGDRILLRSQSEEIVQNNFDLVFSIATRPSIILKEVTAQRNKLISIVCSAVTNPVENNLINSMESSGNNLVVVTEDKNFDKQIDRILFLKPDIKKVLLVYNSVSNADLEKDKIMVDQLLKKRNIELTAIQILNNNELSQKVPNFIKDQDIVLVLKDNMIVAGIESLISICNRFKVPLFASDLNSADKGAAVAYGVQEYDYGVEGAKLAKQILVDKNAPTQISSTIAQDYKLKVNLAALKKQGLHIDEKLLFLIKSGEAV